MRFEISSIAAAALCALATLAAQSALAQAAADAADSIVVEGQYLNATAASAMKLDVPLRDTPFSVSSYSDSFMKAIESAQVADLYKYMTGVQKAGGTAYDITIRGFKTVATDRNAIMVDGLPGLSGRFASPPTIATERIEVVKGPASVLYGQAQPGGFVNLITKKPKAQFAGEVLLKATSFAADDKPRFGDRNGWDTALDVTGPIDKEKKFLYRLLAEKSSDINTWRDKTFADASYVAPSLTWNITGSTIATLQSEFRKTRVSYDRGLAAPSRNTALLPARTTNYSQPGDFQIENGKTYSLSLDHYFANDVKFGFSARRVETNDLSHGLDNLAVLADNQTLSRRAVQLQNGRTSTFYDTNFVIPFTTWGAAHKLIAGTGGGFDTTRNTRIRFFTSAALNTNVYNPGYSGPDIDTLPVGPLSDRDNGSRASGLYAADLITLSERWKVNLGVRRSEETQLIRDVIAGTPATKKVDKKTLPMAGLLYQPTPEWTFYTSYSTAFVPAAVTVQDVFGKNPFVPESSTQYEVGSKADLMGGRLQPSLAIFQIKKKNVLTMFTCPPSSPVVGTCSQQVGAQEVRGFEFELNTRPMEGLQVVGGISHIDGKIVASLDPVQVGAKLQNAAADNAHVWARYDFTGALQGVGIGAGGAYIGKRVGNIPSGTGATALTMQLPGYATADLGLYYTVGNLDFSLRVSNVFDRNYLEATGATPEVQVQMGAPRQVALSMRARF